MAVEGEDIAETSGEGSDRRRFPRVQTPVYYSVAGPNLLHHRRATRDVSLGGMRCYSDGMLRKGTRLRLELILGDGDSIQCWVKVAWVMPASPEVNAEFDMGLEFIDIDDHDRTRLATVLETA